MTREVKCVNVIKTISFFFFFNFPLNISLCGSRKYSEEEIEIYTTSVLPSKIYQIYHKDVYFEYLYIQDLTLNVSTEDSICVYFCMKSHNLHASHIITVLKKKMPLLSNYWISSFGLKFFDL